jgi:NtrC-family two-component system sensor histidine kinase KinB
MGLTLRQRIFFTLFPLLVLIAVLGTAGVVLLSRLGGGIGAILHNNYRSVLYMERLGEALERIDSSFTFALSGPDHEKKARQQFEQSWTTYRDWLEQEKANITEPGEDELVERLEAITNRYDKQGKSFFARPAGDSRRGLDYFGAGGLYEMFTDLKKISTEILHMNHESMEQASRNAKHIASEALIWFGLGLAAAVVFAGVSTWHLSRTIERPIHAVTRSALAISAGDLDQVVPVSRDELGKLAEAFNVMARRLRDLRESHSARLLRAQQTSQATVDSFPDPVMVIDLEGRVEMANPAARRLLGVVPRHKDDASPPWFPPEPLRQPLQAALRGQQDYFPEGFDKAILLGGNGRERAVLPRILTIRDPYGTSLGVAVLLQDVTRLRLLDQIKSNLVATASHELKTPLTSIRLAIHLLLEETTGPLSPKQLELLLDARENTERLLAMVNNLLDLARLEQGWRQLDLRPERPEALLHAAADAAGPRAQDKGIEIVVNTPPGLPAVAADAARIGTALGNLLDNALTYTDPGGRVALAAEAIPDGVVLTVADTGIGIPREHLLHVFEKFFRVPGQSRGSGTGLGLAIVQEVVTAHGGAITCTSQPGVGTTFRLTLPVAPDVPIPGPVFGHANGDAESTRRAGETP